MATSWPGRASGSTRASSDPLGHRPGTVGGVEGVDQDGELVATQAGDGVRAPESGPEAIGHGDEQGVADQVAEAVVDVLEAVEVHDHHRHAPRGPGPPGQGLLEPVVEQGPVGQAGQRIVHGLVADGVLGAEPDGGREHDAAPPPPRTARRRAEGGVLVDLDVAIGSVGVAHREAEPAGLPSGSGEPGEPGLGTGSGPPRRAGGLRGQH